MLLSVQYLAARVAIDWGNKPHVVLSVALMNRAVLFSILLHRKQRNIAHTIE